MVKISNERGNMRLSFLLIPYITFSLLHAEILPDNEYEHVFTLFSQHSDHQEDIAVKILRRQKQHSSYPEFPAVL
jgi:hypothetical protein